MKKLGIILLLVLCGCASNQPERRFTDMQNFYDGGVILCYAATSTLGDIGMSCSDAMLFLNKD